MLLRCVLSIATGLPIPEPNNRAQRSSFGGFTSSLLSKNSSFLLSPFSTNVSLFCIRVTATEQSGPVTCSVFGVWLSHHPACFFFEQTNETDSCCGSCGNCLEAVTAQFVWNSFRDGGHASLFCFSSCPLLSFVLDIFRNEQPDKARNLDCWTNGWICFCLFWSFDCDSKCRSKGNSDSGWTSMRSSWNRDLHGGSWDKARNAQGW